jgi:hypothetical protein
MDCWENRVKAWDQLNKQVPAIRKEIERSFRQLLGLLPSAILCDESNGLNQVTGGRFHKA